LKKQYTKPLLSASSYQLDAAAASGCDYDINHDENTCTFENGQFFNFFTCQFDMTGPDGDGNDALCYHGPMLTMGKTFITS